MFEFFNTTESCSRIDTVVLGQPDVLQGMDLNIKLQLGAQGRGAEPNRDSVLEFWEGTATRAHNPPWNWWQLVTGIAASCPPAATEIPIINQWRGEILIIRVADEVEQVKVIGEADNTETFQEVVREHQNPHQEHFMAFVI